MSEINKNACNLNLHTNNIIKITSNTRTQSNNACMGINYFQENQKRK